MSKQQSAANYRQFIQDMKVEQLSLQRRKLLTPFVARLLSINPIRECQLSTSDIALYLRETLNVTVSVRTVQNYLSLKTKKADYLIPKDFAERLRRIRLRPKVVDFSPPNDLEGLFALLYEVLEECEDDTDYEPVIDAALDEMELLRKENLLRFDVQKPRRISPDQPVARDAVRLSMELAEHPNFDFRDELAYGIGERVGESPDSMPELISLRTQRKVFDPEARDYMGWWRKFSSLKSDSIPKSVQRLLRRDDGTRPRKYLDEEGRPVLVGRPTMRELLLWHSETKKHRARSAQLSEHELFVAYEARHKESARAFFERVQSRLPADIKSLRTFERRYSTWKASR